MQSGNFGMGTKFGRAHRVRFGPTGPGVMRLIGLAPMNDPLMFMWNLYDQYPTLWGLTKLAPLEKLVPLY